MRRPIAVFSPPQRVLPLKPAGAARRVNPARQGPAWQSHIAAATRQTLDMDGSALRPRSARVASVGSVQMLAALDLAGLAQDNWGSSAPIGATPPLRRGA